MDDVFKLDRGREEREGLIVTQINPGQLLKDLKVNTHITLLVFFYRQQGSISAVLCNFQKHVIKTGFL